MKQAKLLAGIVVLMLLLAGLGALVWLRVKEKPEPSPGIEQVEDEQGVAVKVARPVRRDFVDYLYCDGEVVSKVRSVLRAEIAETVEAVHVEVGDAVQKGQLLVTFRKTDLQAEIEAKEAAHEEAEKNYKRNIALCKKGVVSENRVEACRTLLEAVASVLQSAKSRMKFAEVRSPIGDSPGENTGRVRVEARSVEPGERKAEGDKLLALVDLSKVEVLARVPETGLPLCTVGREVEFRFETEDQWRKSTIARVSPTTEDPNRFFDVFLRASNERVGKQWVMRPGMYAEVRVVRKATRGVLAVPANAVKRGEGSQYLFVIRPAEESAAEESQTWNAHKVTVETGLRHEGYVQLIGDAVKDDDILVATPRDQLRDGVKVNIVEGM